MKNFDWTRFTRRIALHADLQTVYNAWTKAGELEKWFLRSCTFMDKNNNTLLREKSVHTGDHYAWTWYAGEEIEHGHILNANGRDRISFSFAGECVVEVVLKESGKDILVELTQSGIPEDDYSKQHVRLGCDSGWSFFLVNLKSFYENGHDLRNKVRELKGVVNN